MEEPGQCRVIDVEFEDLAKWSLLPIGIGLIVYYRYKFLSLGIKAVSRSIDYYIDLKWKLHDIINGTAEPLNEEEKEEEEVEVEEPKYTWVVKTLEYGYYKFDEDGQHYISFNTSAVPCKHHEDGGIEDIKIIKSDGSVVNVSSSLRDVIISCAGHGCIFNHGVPSLKQLRMLPFIPAELDDVKKIIVNTYSYDEYIIS